MTKMSSLNFNAMQARFNGSGMLQISYRDRSLQADVSVREGTEREYATAVWWGAQSHDAGLPCH